MMLTLYGDIKFISITFPHGCKNPINFSNNYLIKFVFTFNKPSCLSCRLEMKKVYTDYKAAPYGSCKREIKHLHNMDRLMKNNFSISRTYYCSSHDQ